MPARLFATLAAAAVALDAQSRIPLSPEPSFVSTPAFSADGRWLAYSAVHSGSARIWLRARDGGSEVALTKDGFDATEPAFAPDGRTLAFRWEARGGGIFTMAYPAASAPRLLVAGGRRPRYSPDGKRITYWAREGVFVIDIATKRTAAVGAELGVRRDPVWSPDGSRLLFHGCKGDACDWWIADPNGGPAAALGMAAAARKAHFVGVPSPDSWMSNGTVLFTAASGERTRLWTIALSADGGALSGDPKRLTQVDRDERWPAVGPRGEIAYVSRTENVDVWMMPLDAARAKAKGPLARLTSDPAIDQRPSLSADGRRIAWETSRGGNFEVSAKDLVSGREIELTNGPLREHMPAVSRDGSRIAYDSHDGDKVTVTVTDFDGGGATRVVEENVGQGAFQWSADGRALLYFYRAPPGSVGLLRLDTRERTPLLRHPKLNLSLSDARLSPDQQWIAFPVPVRPWARLAIARVGSKVIEDERDWTWLTPDNSTAIQPEWSPDGRQLYFLSDRSGRNAVWALSMRAGKAAGPARLVLDFPRASPSIAEMRPRDTGLAIAADKFAIGAAEYRGTLWQLEPK